MVAASTTEPKCVVAAALSVDAAGARADQNSTVVFTLPLDIVGPLPEQSDARRRRSPYQWRHARSCHLITDKSVMTRLAVVAQPTPHTQPEQHAPPVQWLRVKYAKRGRARFTSHRDFGRAFERALRRAGVPMAYTSGYSPHPRISYANAAPTGAASEAEYLEIGLAAVCDPDKVRDALDAALPHGLDVVEVVGASPGVLANELTGSHWRVDVPGLSAATLQAAADAFLAKEMVQVQRMTKNGMREFDTRAAVITLNVQDARLIVTLAHQTPLVRPDDVLAGMRLACPEFVPIDPPVLTRLAQGRLDPESGVITELRH
jgi:radical SAM-linked protein